MLVLYLEGKVNFFLEFWAMRALAAALFSAAVGRLMPVIFFTSWPRQRLVLMPHMLHAPKSFARVSGANQILPGVEFQR